MEIKTFTFNPLQENTYILHHGKESAAIIVDCGALFPEEQQALKAYIEQQQLQPVAHLLTHAHFDHIFGAQYLYETWGLAPQMSTEEVNNYQQARPLMQQLIGQSLPLTTPDDILTFAPHEKLHLADFTLHALPTPGHTPGGTCFHLPEESTLLSGDTIFSNSIGRCDLPGGNYTALLRAIHTHLLTLPPTTRVHPGHGPAFTLEQWKTNRYI